MTTYPWPGPHTAATDRPRLGALQKAHVVLDAFPPGGSAVSAAELARRTGLAKSTTHRILVILADLGMVDRTPEGFRRSTQLADLADLSVGFRPSALRDRLLPHLLDLYELSRLTVHLSVPHQQGALILEQLHGHRSARLPFRIGALLPTHATAVGKVLLAYGACDPPKPSPPARLLPAYTAGTHAVPARLHRELAAIRTEGIAHDTGELRRDVGCVAAPVRGPDGTVIAAVSASGAAYGFDRTRVSGHVRRVAYAASAQLREHASAG